MSPELKIKVFGKNAAEISGLIEQLDLGLVLVEENPDVVISYGGDGTLLGAENKWPGVPKVALRDSKRCLVCANHSNELILHHLAEGKLKPTEFTKLQADITWKDGRPADRLSGINDINLHKALLNAGVRYRVWIDEELYIGGKYDEIVGDGLVIATPFGSAAYYRSITNSKFRTGIGLAFNNTSEPITHLVLREDSHIRVLITRGPAQLAADNDPRVLDVELGDEILIRCAPQNATLLVYDAVKYPADQFIF
jgi:NAD+ kinase